MTKPGAVSERLATKPIGRAALEPGTAAIVPCQAFFTRVASKATLRGMTKPNAWRIEVDLDCLVCPVIGIKFDIGKSRSDNQQRVAVYCIPVIARTGT